VRFICFDCHAHVWFGSLFDCWCVVRLVSQLHLNQLFLQINKVSLKSFTYLLSLWNFHYSFTPATVLFGNSLSHQRLYFRWPTQGTAITTTTLTTTMGRTTRTSTHRRPLCLLLSMCWLYNHKCFRPWSTCKLLNLKHCH
jgi:hypothetical protein